MLDITALAALNDLLKNSEPAVRIPILLRAWSAGLGRPLKLILCSELLTSQADDLLNVSLKMRDAVQERVHSRDFKTLDPTHRQQVICRDAADGFRRFLHNRLELSENLVFWNRLTLSKLAGTITRIRHVAESSHDPLADISSQM